jgi:N-acetylglucosaminyldiphosphoundecaprenol N-acetyl-beta-D-mannosaminyltransferase
VSDLCPVDGVPIVWIARLLGVPIRRRVAGSDIFEALKLRENTNRPSRIFLFGGPPGVAEAASKALNAQSDGVVCVGSFYPGFCSVEEMSSDEIIQTINSSGADFLILSLGAKKGQSWLMHNHPRLKIPVRSHLGAAISFQAGTLKRAPTFVRKFGLEWLWRIKEEPHLWRRYWQDGIVLLKLMFACVLPLAFSSLLLRLSAKKHDDSFCVQIASQAGLTTVSLVGAATAANVDRAIPVFRGALLDKKDLRIDIAGVRLLDARFFGLFLMVWKQLKANGARPQFVGLSSYNRRAFRLHGFEFLLREMPKVPADKPFITRIANRLRACATCLYVPVEPGFPGDKEL